MMRYRKPKICAKWQNVHGRSKKSLWWYWTSILFSLCDTRQKCAFLHQYHYVSCLLFRVKLSPVITRKATLATEMLLKFNAFSAKKKTCFIMYHHLVSDANVLYVEVEKCIFWKCDTCFVCTFCFIWLCWSKITMNLSLPIAWKSIGNNREKPLCKMWQFRIFTFERGFARFSYQ